MSSVIHHYDSHLGNFYSWMVGDFESNQRQQEDFFRKSGLVPFTDNKIAIDLGAGHGLQSISFAKLGFAVKSVDLVKLLLFELQHRIKSHNIEILVDDLRNVNRFKTLLPELIVCYGDTISHLNNYAEIQQLIIDCYNTLVDGGKLLLSFRDYSLPLEGTDRFIPIKSDANRSMLCFLEYFEHSIQVTDIINERTEDGWQQKVSSYSKVRIFPEKIIAFLQSIGFVLKINELINNQIVIVAQK